MNNEITDILNSLDNNDTLFIYMTNFLKFFRDGNTVITDVDKLVIDKILFNAYTDIHSKKSSGIVSANDYKNVVENIAKKNNDIQLF